MHLFRQIFRNKWLSVINISGLAVGLATSMFLLLHLNYEFSFDKYFTHKERIYRMLTLWENPKESRYLPICLRSVRESLLREVPEVEEVVQFYKHWGATIASVEEKQAVLEVRALYVDVEFLKVFDFKVLRGDVIEALGNTGQCVVTESLARKLFGKTDVLGQAVMIDQTLGEIGAVVQDVPQNTQFTFEMLTGLGDRFNWMGGLEFHTYVMFNKEVDYQSAVYKCNQIYDQLLNERFQTAAQKYTSVMEPLPLLHISSLVTDDELVLVVNKTNLYFITVLVLFVLGIVVANFITLTVIQGERRSLEVSIRKTNGGSRGNIIAMLFGETAVVTLISFATGLLLFASCSGWLSERLEIEVPYAASLIERLSDLSLQTWFWFVALYLFTVSASGFYPSLYLSRFNPITLIQKSFERRHRLTIASVVVQFSIVVFCIVSLLMVDRQLQFLKRLPLGYNPDHVLVGTVEARYSQFEGLRAELKQTPQITAVALSDGLPVDFYSGQLIRLEGSSEKDAVLVRERRPGWGYFETFEIPIVEGRDFTGNFEVDQNAIILSETAAKTLNLAHPIGQKILYHDTSLEVIGVAKDVVATANELPQVLVYTMTRIWYFDLSVRFEPGSYEAAKEAMNALLSKHFPDEPVHIELLKDKVLSHYLKDEVTARILAGGSALAIVLALLGLLALSGFVARQKFKEIGLRRAMGAQVTTIVYSLMRYILLRILPALPVGMAIAYYAMRQWLKGFAYTTGISWGLFVLGGVLTVTIALLTISAQTIYAATANPVEAIKSE